MATFNIDEMKSGFKPVTVTFRGKEYALGTSAVGILQVCELHGEIANLDGLEFMSGFMKQLPQMLKLLCEDFPTEGLDAAESMALMKVLTEVMARISQLTFPEEEQGGDTASDAG